MYCLTRNQPELELDACKIKNKLKTNQAMTISMHATKKLLHFFISIEFPPQNRKTWESEWHDKIALQTTTSLSHSSYTTSNFLGHQLFIQVFLFHRSQAAWVYSPHNRPKKFWVITSSCVGSQRAQPNFGKQSQKELYKCTANIKYRIPFESSLKMAICRLYFLLLASAPVWGKELDNTVEVRISKKFTLLFWVQYCRISMWIWSPWPSTSQTGTVWTKGPCPNGTTSPRLESSCTSDHMQCQVP